MTIAPFLNNPSMLTIQYAKSGFTINEVLYISFSHNHDEGWKYRMTGLINMNICRLFPNIM